MRFRRAVLAVLALVLLAAGCSSETSITPSASAPDATAGAFPVTIQHAFGSTEIAAEPQRVVAWGWGSADAAIALARPADRGADPQYRSSCRGGPVPTVFSRIIAGELPARFVWTDDVCVAFLTVAPLRPGHVLVVPRAEVDRWTDADDDLLAHLVDGRLILAVRETQPGQLGVAP